MTVAVGGPPIILIAEDDRLLRRMAVEMLTAEGYETVSVAGATEALTRLRALPAITLLITDINMPGMSGLELAKLARQQSPALRLLVISGRAQVDVGALPESACFLPKPFSARSLLVQVRNLVGS